MKDLTPVGKLDFVLRYLQRNNIVVSGIDECVITLSNIEFDIDELNLILKQLVDDGFAYQINYNNAHSITFKGLLFDSYEKQAQRQSTSNRNERIQTLLLTSGTALAGLYGVFEMLKWGFHHFHVLLPF